MNGFDLDMRDYRLLGRMLEAGLTYDMTEDESAEHIIDHIVEI